MDDPLDAIEAPSRPAVPRVDAVVCVHTATRPVERATASALRNEVALRVTVVAHNTDVAAVRARLGTLIEDDRVRILELSDGVRSPANAFNFAIDNASGEFLSLIGSDDELSSGALDAWVRLADRKAADVVVAPIMRVNAGAVPAPRTRSGRIAGLDGDRDRLFERVAPLGLVRLARFPGLRFAEGLPRGVDQVFGLHLWFSGAAVAFDPASPAYLEWDDQTDRVTTAGGPLANDFGYLELIEQDDVFRSMPAAARRAVAARIVRVYLVGGIERRMTDEGLGADDRATLTLILQRLRGWAPGLDGLLALRDRRAVHSGLDPQSTGHELRRAIGDRSRYLTPDALITVNPFMILHRHAPLRSLMAGRRVARMITGVR